MYTQHIDESPKNVRGGQVSYLMLTDGQFGSGNLSITWVECEPGSQQPVHEHFTNEQVYIIVRGAGTMIVGEEERDVREGELVYIPPRTGHAIRNNSSEPLVYVSATSPPFDVSELEPTFAYTQR